MKITDTLEEQAALEAIVEDVKPAVPDACKDLHYLLVTPFRYSALNPFGSRFRKPYAAAGVFYGSAHPHTAIAESAFYKVLFFAESPQTPWPTNPSELTAFAAEFRTSQAIDISRPPHTSDGRLYELANYSNSQVFAEVAREAGIEAIKYKSVRDPKGLANLALLTCTAFSKPEPVGRQTWRVHLDRNGVRAICESPRLTIAFDTNAFAADPRLSKLNWSR